MWKPLSRKILSIKYDLNAIMNFLIDNLDNTCIGYCHNNGTCSVSCTDISCGTPNCTCRNGYTGAQCDIIAGGVCQSNTCINGVCVLLTNTSSQCQCSTGFLGTRCDLSKKRETDNNKYYLRVYS